MAVKPKVKGDCVSLCIRNVPRNIRNHFKAWCSLHNVTMEEKIVSLMRDTVKSAILEKKP